MRLLYTLAWLLVLPLMFVHLLRRARRQPEYRRHWAERLGFAPRLAGRPVLWVHAVSVGETRAAAPLLLALAERHPTHVVLLTHATPTGRATGAELFAERLGERFRQAYLPYDLPWAAHLFLARARPCLGVFMETEIWPNLYAACRAGGVPIYLANARLSSRSARGYARFRPLIAGALGRLSGIAAQTPADAERLTALGARAVRVTGNLKFDVTPPPDTEMKAAELRRLFGRRFVWLAASTRDGEEALILDAFARLTAPPPLPCPPLPGEGGERVDAALIPDLLLVIVPRHPQRFQEVAALLEARGLAGVKRSAGRPVPADGRVFLGDSMGEMAAYYSACDLAFVGGSLRPLGGQNLIEPCALGRPVLIGPHTWNFQDAAEQAVAAGAALRVRDAAELAAQVGRLYADPVARQAMGTAGVAFTAGHRGATERLLAMLEADVPGHGFRA